MKLAQEREKIIPVFAPSWNNLERHAVMEALGGDYLNEDKKVREFESAFAKYVHAKYCIFVPNGALALYLACKGARVEYNNTKFAIGDYYSIFAANALIMVGKMPELIDTDKYGIISEKERVFPYEVIPVHVNGRLCKIDELSTDQIEDCGQMPNHHTPKSISCYSFHSTKLITAAGIGGAVCCDDKNQYERMCAIKDHGRPERALGQPVTDYHYFWGTNLKMSEVNAAFALEQLKKLPTKLARMKEMYKIYREEFKAGTGKYPVVWYSKMPSWRIDCEVVDPELVKGRLERDGVKTQRFYKPTHMQMRFGSTYEDGKFPNTMHIYQHGLYLPSSTSLEDEEIIFICDLLKKAIA